VHAKACLKQANNVLPKMHFSTSIQSGGSSCCSCGQMHSRPYITLVSDSPLEKISSEAHTSSPPPDRGKIGKSKYSHSLSTGLISASFATRSLKFMYSRAVFCLFGGAVCFEKEDKFCFNPG
jgi:hypothetical protein